VAELVGCRSGWGGDIGELGCEGGHGLPVAFECLAFVVGEVELFEHLPDSALDLEELSLVVFWGRSKGQRAQARRWGHLAKKS
jgi:hypothetical protein